MEKICNHCKIPKELKEFNKNKRTEDGYSCNCRECMKEVNRLSYQKNKKECNKKAKKWYKNNKEKHLQRNKEYGKNNPEIRRKATAKYLKNNPEYYNNYRKNRYNNDPQFKLRIILGNRLNEVLKKNKTYKVNNIIKLLGCTIEECKQHLEKQFRYKMNWNNHGNVWEIDHITPCDSFDLTKLEEQKQCFHFLNLQPLFKTENRQKSNKII